MFSISVVVTSGVSVVGYYYQQYIPVVSAVIGFTMSYNIIQVGLILVSILFIKLGCLKRYRLHYESILESYYRSCFVTFISNIAGARPLVLTLSLTTLKYVTVISISGIVVYFAYEASPDRVILILFTWYLIALRLLVHGLVYINSVYCCGLRCPLHTRQVHTAMAVKERRKILQYISLPRQLLIKYGGLL